MTKQSAHHEFRRSASKVNVSGWPLCGECGLVEEEVVHRPPEHPVIGRYVYCDMERGDVYPASHATGGCRGNHRTVLRGDLIEPPHVHEWKRWNEFGDYDSTEWCSGRVIWICEGCPAATNPDDAGRFSSTQAPKPSECGAEEGL